MKALRVAFFTECYRPIVNGVVASVDGLADELRARGNDVFTFAPSAPGYLENDGPVFRMPSLPLPAATQYRLTLPFVSRRNRTEILRTADIVHTHSPFVTGWMGVHYARRYNVPLVFTYHTQLEHYIHYVPFDPTTTRRFVAHLTKTYANATDAVIVPTTAMETRLRELGVTARIVTSPSGIDVARFSGVARRAAVRAQLGPPAAVLQLLVVSRLGKEKQIGRILEALALMPAGVCLAIVGEGPERGELEAQSGRLGLIERVRFLGALEQSALPEVYAAADVFVFASRSETQGLVLAEAMAAGLPIAAVGTRQTREVVGEAGFFCEDGAPALARAIGAAADARSSDLTARLRAGAQRFSHAAHAGRVLALYAELLAGRDLGACEVAVASA